MRKFIFNSVRYNMCLCALVISFSVFQNKAYSQTCACVNNDVNGNLICTMYANCGDPNFQNCRTKPSTPALYAVAPKTPTQNCPTIGSCNPYSYNTAYGANGTNGGSCWYQGSTCAGDVVCNYVTTLPITLISLKGNVQNGENIIEWITASEWNSDYFILMFSTDGINYENVAALSAAGNSSGNKSYRVNHVDPKPLINYYKLIQVDTDGELAEYGPISIDNREIKFTSTFSDLYPNPTEDMSSFLYGGRDFETEINLTILNTIGEIIFSQNINNFNRYQGIQISTLELSNGIYQILIRQGAVIEIKKITVVH